MYGIRLMEYMYVYTKERELKNEYRETVRVLQAEVRSGRIHM